jgi:hypothetical protein
MISQKLQTTVRAHPCHFPCCEIITAPLSFTVFEQLNMSGKKNLTYSEEECRLVREAKAVGLQQYKDVV